MKRPGRRRPNELSAHRLRKALSQYGVKPEQARVGDSKDAVRGYWAKELEEVIKQYGYEPPKQPEQANESEQPEYHECERDLPF